MMILPEPANRLTEVVPSKSTDVRWPCVTRGTMATLPISSLCSRRTASPGPATRAARSSVLLLATITRPVAMARATRESPGKEPDITVARLVSRCALSHQMEAGLRTHRSVLRLLVDHGPIRCERHGQSPHYLEEFLQFHDGRERFGHRRQKRQGISLVDEGALPMLLRALPLGDFHAQALVRLLERECALFHPSLELGLRSAQRVFVLTQRSLSGHTLGDIDGVAENVGSASRLFAQHVAVHPHARLSVPGNDAHQPGVLPLVADALEVVVEQMARFGREKPGEVQTDPVLGLVAERMRGRWIDRQQTTVQVVSADETQTVLDEVAIPSLALFERLFGLLPGRSHLVEVRWCFLGHAPPAESSRNSPAAVSEIEALLYADRGGPSRGAVCNRAGRDDAPRLDLRVRFPPA